MIDEPGILHVDAQITATIRLRIPRAQMQTVMGPAIGEVMGALAAQGVKPGGAVFSRHFRMDPELFDFEVGVPVGRLVHETGRVQVSLLPAAKVARTIYRGPYEGLGEAWGEFEEWIAAEGHECAAGLWECYVAGPESGADASQWRTELTRPLVR